MTAINDRQLDHANAENERIRKGVIAISRSHAKLFDLLKEVASCGISQTLGRYHEVQIPVALWDQIREETDESEVVT